MFCYQDIPSGWTRRTECESSADEARRPSATIYRRLARDERFMMRVFFRLKPEATKMV
jgi:hypothetical protein